MTNNGFFEKMNGVGITFRFITPILMGIIGWFLISGLNGIEKKIEKLDSHFSNHLIHHQDLEIGYEKRLGGIEGSLFSNSDGNVIDRRVAALESKVSGLPPQWLVNQVSDLEKKVYDLQKEVIRKSNK